MAGIQGDWQRRTRHQPSGDFDQGARGGQRRCRSTRISRGEETQGSLPGRGRNRLYDTHGAVGDPCASLPAGHQLAALPFMAADATAKAGQDAERLQQEAAKARQDLEECGNRLATTYPELAGKFREALSGESFRQTLQEEMRSALQEHADLPVVLLPHPEEMSFAPFLGEASRRQLQSVLEIDVHSLDLSTEQTSGDAVDCGYKIVGDVKLQWWDVGTQIARSSSFRDRAAFARIVTWWSTKLDNANDRYFTS
jgi:hypothetical protein